MAEIKLSTQTVEMREPKVRDLRLVANIENQAEMEIKLIGNLTGLTESEIDDLSLKDYAKLTEQLALFQ